MLKPRLRCLLSLAQGILGILPAQPLPPHTNPSQPFPKQGSLSSLDTHSRGQAGCQRHLQVPLQAQQSRNQDKHLSHVFEDVPVLQSQSTLNKTIKQNRGWYRALLRAECHPLIVTSDTWHCPERASQCPPCCHTWSSAVVFPLLTFAAVTTCSCWAEKPALSQQLSVKNPPKSHH